VEKKIRTNFLVKNLVVWWKRRFGASSSFSFHPSFSTAKSVLVCFPASKEEFASAANHLPALADIFSSSKIYLLLPLLEADSFIANWKSYEIISPRPADLKPFSLPSRKFIERIKKHDFGIAIDLDLKGCLFNALTCFSSGTPLRIGMEGKWGKPFYNIQLVTQKGLVYLDQRYDAMLETLRFLRNGAGAQRRS
jgi:hypothetical protein